MARFIRAFTSVALMICLLVSPAHSAYALDDTTPPVLQGSSPADGATGVNFTSTTLDFVLTFSEPVLVKNDLGYFQKSGSINRGASCISVVINQSGNTTSPALSYIVEGNTVTISPGYYSNWYSSNNDVTATIRIEAGSVSDEVGNLVAASVITLYGNDTTAPYVLGYEPPTSQQLIDSNDPVIVYFSEVVVAGSQYGNIKVTQQDTGDEIPIHKAINGTQMSITPADGSWADGDDHTFVLSWPAGALADRAGLTCPVNNGKTFKTRDCIKPSLLAHYPLDDDSGILNTAAITLDYSEPVYQTGNLDGDAGDPVVVTVNGQFKLVDIAVSGANHDRLAITPASGKWADDNDGSLVHVTVRTEALRDEFGNNVDQDTTFSFTLKDSIAPVVVSADPENNGVLESNSDPYLLTFSKQIVEGDDWDSISVQYNGIPVAVSKQINGDSLSIQPTSGSWANNSGVEYSVVVPAGAIKDKSGNNLAADYQSVFNAIAPTHPSEVAVHFDLQYGSKVSSSIVSYGTPVLKPADPVRTGFRFGGWYAEPAFQTLWDFGVAIEEETTLYAKWVLVSLSAPKPVTAASLQYNSVLVKWSAVENATGYEVWRAATSTGSYSRVGVTKSTSLPASGLATGSTYYFKVRATGTGASTVYSSFSSVVSARPIPAVPASAKAVMSTYNSIRVSWGAVSGATKYEVYRSTSSSGTYTRMTSTTATYFTNTSVNTGTTYYYKVRAYRLVGSTKVYGSFSPVVYAKATLAAPGSPKASLLSYNSIKVTWGSVAGASKYELYRSTSSGGTYSLVTATSYLYYTNSNVNTGTTYYYKVRAYRLVGRTKVYSGFSAIVSARPVLATPSSVKVSRLTSSSMKITWGTVAGATKYEVWQSKSDGVTGEYTYSLLATTGYTYYTYSSMTPGKYYQYKVRAYRLIGTTKVYSNFSSVVVCPVYIRTSAVLPYQYVSVAEPLTLTCNGGVMDMNSVKIKTIKDMNGQLWLGVSPDLNDGNSVSYPVLPGLSVRLVNRSSGKVLFYYYVD